MKINVTVYEVETILEAAKNIGLELAKSKDIPVTEEQVKQELTMDDVKHIENKCGYIDYNKPSDSGLELYFNPEFVADFVNICCTPIGIRVAKFVVSTVKFIISTRKELDKTTKVFEKKWFND